jgi:hypothetical protein
MIMNWGVSVHAFPLADGVKGDSCLIFRRNCSSRRSFGALFGGRTMRVKTQLVSVVGRLLATQG